MDSSHIIDVCVNILNEIDFLKQIYNFTTIIIRY